MRQCKIRVVVNKIEVEQRSVPYSSTGSRASAVGKPKYQQQSRCLKFPSVQAEVRG
jgi:hypothetical protein